MDSKPRISKDTYFMNIAKAVAARSTCLRRQVGAIIVVDGRIVSTGYNGAPKGARHCLDMGCLRDELKIPSGTQHSICRAVHGEENAIIQCAVHGVSPVGGTLYCTHAPCVMCIKTVVNAGIKRIVYDKEYPNMQVMQNTCNEAGIQVTHLV